MDGQQLDAMRNVREVHRYVALLKDFARKKDLSNGTSLHLDIRKRGFLKRSVYLHLSSSLINMYAKCGALDKAHEVLEELHIRNEFSWNALVSGYAQHGFGQEAINCFDRMQAEGLTPDAITFTAILKACGKIGSIHKGKQIHDVIVSRGLLEKDIVLGNALVDMYAKCLVLPKSQQVFEGLPVRDVISWNALIVGYAQHGQAHSVLNCFEEMLFEGLHADGITFICVLKACGNIGAIEKGKQIHEEISCMDLLDNNIVLGNALIDMYTKCGALAKAQQVLEDLARHDVVSWNSLIAGYNQQGQCREALHCFEQMQVEGVHPDVVTYSCIMKVCGSIQALEKGKHIHNMVKSKGLLENHYELKTGLICMYAQCGALAVAKEVLEGLSIRSVDSWSALISGYAQLGQSKEALNCFEHMQSEGFSPDVVTFIYIMKSCSNLGDINKGKKIHDELVNRGFLGKDIMLGSALVDMYAKCGALAQAQEVLDKLPVQDVVCWNALITGYAQQGNFHKALNCFERMQTEGLSPNSVTFICILKLCGNIGDIEKGEQIHEDIMSGGLLEKDIVLGNALVDMYAKCGLMARAQEAFLSLPMRDIVSWNILITGYAHWEEGHKALTCFEQMQIEGLSPDTITFICTLKACGNTNNIEKGQEIHKVVANMGFLEKDVSVGNSLVDMYAKFGMLTKAENVLEELPVRDVVTWNSLISGYAQQGQLHEALRCIEIMQEEGFVLDEVTFIAILKACGSLGDIDGGKQIHEEIVRRGLLEKHVVLGNALVDMYAKCSDLAKAQEVLRELPIRNVVPWSALIAGYVQQEQGGEALNTFERMQNEGLHPDTCIFDCLLKACGSTCAIGKGKQIHCIAMNRGLVEQDIMLGSTLIDMYSKCGMLAKAEELLKELLLQDVVSWNMLIAGYAQEGWCHEAFRCFGQMQNECLLPNEVTYVLLLKTCCMLGGMDKGKQIHTRIASPGLVRKDIILGNALVDMYAKCGALEKAQELLEELPDKDIVSWNTLIAGFSKHEQDDRALSSFQQMQKIDLSPDLVTFICILKACGSIGAIDKGKQIHEEIVSRGLLKNDIILGNALVDMYVKCGMLEKAKDVFDELSKRDIVSWNTLLTGYAQQGQFKEALNCFEKLKSVGLSPDTVSFICILKACGSTGAIENGKEIHDEMLYNRLLENDIALGNSLIDMYAKCGVLAKAQKVLEQLPVRDVVSWTALISGYAQYGQYHETWKCFEGMQEEGISPNAVTFISILKVCGSTGAIERAEQTHNEIVHGSFLKKSVQLGNALVDMYGKCGMFAKAHEVLKKLPGQDVASWNSLISGYTEHGQGYDALNCFESMQSEGLSPNAVTYICILKACGRAGAVQKGKQIHDEIISRDMLENDLILGNTLVDMYVKFDMLATAREVLEQLPMRDAISWNILISGYSHQGQYHEAFNCFEQMQIEGLSGDLVTFVCILKVCGNMGVIDKAKEIHGHIMNKRLLEKDVIIGNALVDMYAKNGVLGEARKVHEELPFRDLVSWNALISGYSNQGQGREVLDCFEQMQAEGIPPDEITFILLMSACSHLGLLDEAEKLFGYMTEKHGIIPDLWHQTGMVVVFGCVGKFERAMSVISAMPSSDYLTVWLALLGSCRKWGNVKLGSLAFDRIVKLDERCGAAYVLMADIFSSSGMQEDAKKVKYMQFKHSGISTHRL